MLLQVKIWLHNAAWRIMQATGLDPVTFAWAPNVPGLT